MESSRFLVQWNIHSAQRGDYEHNYKAEDIA